jgi:hypothetical protein
MKKQLIYCSFSIMIALLSCKSAKEELTKEKSKSESLSDFECIRKSIDKSLSTAEVKSKIYGEWILTGIIADIPNPIIPDLKVAFKDVLGAPIDKQFAEVYKNGELSYTTTYSLKETKEGDNLTVFIEADKMEYAKGEVALFNSRVRICENELMLDTGMAHDAPAYLFRKK